MIIAENVRSRPGGRVVVLFGEHGYATRPLNAGERVRVVALWLGTAALIGFLPSFLPIWWADRVEADNAWLYFTPMAFCLLALAGIGLVLAAREYAEMAVMFLVLAAMVACFPLLLLLVFPGVRRAVFRRKASEEDRPRGDWERQRALPAGFSPPVAYVYVGRARLTRSGGRVTVELHHTNGHSVVFSARGEAAGVLAARFQDRLGPRLVGGSGPAHV